MWTAMIEDGNTVVVVASVCCAALSLSLSPVVRQSILIPIATTGSIPNYMRRGD
jgi:hypothetical protein